MIIINKLMIIIKHYYKQIAIVYYATLRKEYLYKKIIQSEEFCF